MNRFRFKTTIRLAALIIGVTVASSASANEVADVYPVPADHLRIVTWNIEVFNLRNADPFHASNPNGPRTDAQLDAVAQRIHGFGAAIVALQEMNQYAALIDLKDRMNQGEEGPWRAVAANFQQNALLFDESKVEAIESGFATSSLSGDLYPEEFYYRAPVHALFRLTAGPDVQFRVIGIHGSWQGSTIREAQGEWLGAYVSDLLDDEHHPRLIVLTGDMNGVAASGNVPHDGIVASGELTYVPKSNGESTAIGGAQIDSFYLTDEGMGILTDRESMAIRNDFFEESEEDFRATHSDHFPVFLDLALAPPAPPAVPALSPTLSAIQALLFSLIGIHLMRRRHVMSAPSRTKTTGRHSTGSCASTTWRRTRRLARRA